MYRIAIAAQRRGASSAVTTQYACKCCVRGSRAFSTDVVALLLSALRFCASLTHFSVCKIPLRLSWLCLAVDKYPIAMGKRPDVFDNVWCQRT